MPAPLTDQVKLVLENVTERRRVVAPAGWQIGRVGIGGIGLARATPFNRWRIAEICEYTSLRIRLISPRGSWAAIACQGVNDRFSPKAIRPGVSNICFGIQIRATV